MPPKETIRRETEIEKPSTEKEETPRSFQHLMELAFKKAPLPPETRDTLTTLVRGLSEDDLQNPARIISKLSLLATESAASQFKHTLLDSLKNNPVANQAYARLTL